MSQNLKIKGVNYNGVDSVKIPTQSGGTADFIIPSGTKNITSNGTHDVKGVASAVVNVPTLDTSDANADVYDIYNGKTAYVNGQKITGAYKFIYPQINSGSANCSAEQLSIPCDFEPSAVAVVYNSESYINNRVVAVWATKSSSGVWNAIIYHSKTTSSLSRTQITSGADSYISYDAATKTLKIKRPSSSYSWASNNYRVFCFK